MLSVSRIFLTFIFFVVIIFPSNSNVLFGRSVSCSHLIRQVCFNSSWEFDPRVCARILLSDAEIASAKTLYNLSIAIMKAGQKNTTGTRAYIKERLGNPRMDPKVKAVFQKCKSSYDLAVASFKFAMSEVIDDNDPQTATYDLLVGCTDDLHPCLEGLAKYRVEDKVVQSGNTALQIYGLSAYEVLNRL